MSYSRLSKQVIVRLQVEGIHNWETCDINEVMFLKYPHRHIFHIELAKSVEDSDREIEIIMLKRHIKNYLGEEPVKFRSKSCEMIAEDLLNVFDADYVIVTEDGENGAKISKI